MRQLAQLVVDIVCPDRIFDLDEQKFFNKKMGQLKLRSKKNIIFKLGP